MRWKRKVPSKRKGEPNCSAACGILRWVERPGDAGRCPVSPGDVLDPELHQFLGRHLVEALVDRQVDGEINILRRPADAAVEDFTAGRELHGLGFCALGIARDVDDDAAGFERVLQEPELDARLRLGPTAWVGRWLTGPITPDPIGISVVIHKVRPFLWSEAFVVLATLCTICSISAQSFLQ